MTESQEYSFKSKLRQRLFPVHSHEFAKFFSLTFVHIFIICNFWILHNLKDSLIVTSPGSGSEVINYLKIVGVFPASVIFVILFSWLSNHYSQRTLFFAILGFFLVFFALFITIIHPNIEFFHFSPEKLDLIKSKYPRIQWMIPIVGYWSYALLYVVAEMWSAIVLTFLFWQFANQITPIEQARRFYMLIASLSCFGMIAAGVITKSVKHLFGNNINQQVDFLILMALIFTVLILFVYHWMHKNVVRDDQRYHPEKSQPAKKTKIKMSLANSFKYIFRSDYLAYIAILGISYNISINFVEITWKKQVKIMYPSTEDYLAFMGEYNLWLAPVMFVTGIIGSNIVRKFSWKTSAMVTPIVSLLMACLFFLMAIYGEACVSLFSLGFTAVAGSCWIGLVQNLSTKSCKQSFFNTTREMAYIPLDAELRVKGKAAVDVLSGRIGKLGGAGIQGFLLILIPGATQTTIAPYLAVCVFVIFILWTWAIKRMNVKLLAMTKGELSHPAPLIKL